MTKHMIPIGVDSKHLETMPVETKIMERTPLDTKAVENALLETVGEKDLMTEIQMPLIKVTSLGHLQSTIHSADVTLVCGNREFPAHRLILSGNSLYFHSVLQTQESSDFVVAVPEQVSDEVLEVILGFLYSGELQEKEDKKEFLLTVLSASKVLQMDNLFAYTLRRLAEYLSANCLQDFFHLITEYEDTGWATQIVTHIVDKLSILHTRSDFYNLDVNEFNKILQYVKLDRENTGDFMSILVTWLNCSQFRNDDINDLTSICKFTHLSAALWPVFWNENDEEAKVQKFLEVVSMNGENSQERTPNTQKKIYFSSEEEQEENVSYERFV